MRFRHVAVPSHGRLLGVSSGSVVGISMGATGALAGAGAALASRGRDTRSR
jgi:S-formylglutathione hydrolase FrmB